MEHVVFFTGADGAAQYRRTPSIEDAVRFVEHLRNVENVEDVRVFTLTEVPLSFRAVYRVEVPGVTAPAAATVEEPVAEAPAEPVAEPVAEEPVPAMVPAEPFVAEVYAPQADQPANGKHGARGLGFFSR